jgi:hypothetical protein
MGAVVLFGRTNRGTPPDRLREIYRAKYHKTEEEKREENDGKNVHNNPLES